MHMRFCNSWRLSAVAILAALLTTGEALAEEGAPDTQGGRQRGKPSTRSRPSGRSGKAEELFGISWFNSLEAARKAAGHGKSPDQGKPIFCFRVLGDLAGFM